MVTKSELNAELIGRLYTQELSYKKISREMRLSCGTIYQYICAMSLGFNSPNNYRKYMAGYKGISCRIDRDHFISERGFLSEKQYKIYREEQKQKRPKNMALSNLIKTRLEEIGKNQYWLSKQINVSRQMISLYCSARRIPKRHILRRIFTVLNVSYRNLEDIISAQEEHQ